jgi:hypothetical protein
MPPPRIRRIPRTEDDKPKFAAWDSLPILISAIAVSVSVGTGFVFLLSCIHLWNIEKVLGFYATSYVDFGDYVQSIPTVWGTVAAIFAFVLVLYALAIAIICILTDWKRRRLLLKWIGASLIALAIVYMVGIIYTTWKESDTLKNELSNEKPSTVFRKGECPIKGIIFLHSSRYIFLWMSNENSFVVIPNVEVQMIQTASNPAVSSSTVSASRSYSPINSPAAKAGTPSPASSTPK